MDDTNATDIKTAVRDRYAEHARTKTSCCPSSCCGGAGSASPETMPIDTCGYGSADLAAVPEDADLGLGCGKPLAFDTIRQGETVVDLGSGGGIDCFIAARRTGPTGRVIGVDMTPEMVALARRNAARGGYDNVEFRLGEIEALPIADDTADLIISNCVVNLVPDKHRAFAEAFRVARPGGRISVSDIVTSAPLPDVFRESLGAYVACLAGAAPIDDYMAAIADAGFDEIEVVSDRQYAMDGDEVAAWLGALAEGPPSDVDRSEALAVGSLFHSVTVRAVKPVT